MIAEKLNRALRCHGERPFLLAPSGQWTYSDMHRHVHRVAGYLQQLGVGKIACQLPNSPDLISLVLASAVTGTSLTLLNPDYSEQQVRDLALELEIGLLVLVEPLAGHLPCQQITSQALQELDGKPQVQDTQGSFAEVDSELLILTSGTTEQPKCVSYRWSDLLQQVQTGYQGQGDRWLLAYKLNHFAGVQMLAHILVTGGTLVLAESSRVADAVGAMTSLGVSHVSSTPTFWRFALNLLANADSLPKLRQITLGSEPVSANLLDQLAALFPTARIVHIYALTEAGSCISVSDGKPGLPIAVLDRAADARVRFRIRDDELLVKTLHGMRGYRMLSGDAARDGDGWFCTGDLVRIEDDRILFVGRKSETINVGGVKVHPLEVENVIAALPGVKLALAYGLDNPIVGQIVAVDLMINDGWCPQAVEDSVRTACQCLPRHSRPRRINIVENIETNNYKLARRGVKRK